MGMEWGKAWETQKGRITLGYGCDSPQGFPSDLANLGRAWREAVIPAFHIPNNNNNAFLYSSDQLDRAVEKRL